MKTLGKRLTLLLTVLVLVVVQKPRTADAASIALNKKSLTLYLNGSHNENYQDNFNFDFINEPTNYKSRYRVEWSIDDETIADVDKNGSVKVLKTGFAILTCSIYKKSTGKLYKELSANITVKANAKTVTINNAPENNRLKAGETFDFNRTMVAENGGRATDKTVWVISDETVATVDNNGVVTALKPGTFTIQAVTYQASSYIESGDYTAMSEKVTIDVVNTIKEVKAVGTSKLAVTFAAPVKELKTTDFIITNTASGARTYVSHIYKSEEAAVYTVELYNGMVNGKTYKVSVNDMSANVDFKKGVPAAIELKDQTILPGKASSVVFRVLDENGIDLTAEEIDRCTMTASKGVVNKTNLTLLDGEEASVQITYSDTSDPQNVRTFSSRTASVKGVSEYFFECTTIDRMDSTYVNFTTIKSSVSVGSEGQKLYVRVKDKQGNFSVANLDGGCRLFFSSLTPEIATITEDGRITALTPGDCYVQITGAITDKKIINVRAADKDTVMNVISSPGSLTNASDEGARHELNNVKITCELQNQYNEILPDGTRSITISHVSGDSVVTYQGQSLSDPLNPVIVKNGVISLSPVAAGTERISLSCGNLNTTAAITVKPADNTVSSQSIVGSTNLNIAKVYDESEQGESSTILAIYSMNKEGFYIDQIPISDDTFLKITDNDGKVISISPVDNEYRLTEEIVKGLPSGAYSITGKLNGVEKEKIYFNVTDTSISPTVSFVGTTIENERITLSSVEKCLKIPEGFSLAGFKFSSTEEAAVENVPGFVTEVPVDEEYTGSSFLLTLSEVQLVRRSSGRDYSLPLRGVITVISPVKDSLTPLQKLSRLISKAEVCVLSDKTTASAEVFTEALEDAEDELSMSEEEGYVEVDHTAELQDAFNALKAAMNHLEAANVTVSLSFSPEGSCILSGNGKYKCGDTIEIAANVKEGYAFDGWYQNGSKISGDVAFSFTAGSEKEELSYEARLTAYTEKKKLTVQLEGTGSVICEALESETNIKERTELEYVKGTFIMLTANVSSDDVFLYWRDNTTDKILDTGTTYGFYLTEAVSISACYGNKTGSKFTVVFKDMNGKVLSTEEVTEGSAATAPTNLGHFTGYSFMEWDSDFSNVTKDMVITAKYRAEEGYSVSVINGIILNEKTSYVYGEAVTVKAEETKEGLSFNGWYLNGIKMSGSPEFTFYLVEKNTSAEAEYVIQAEEIKEPVLSFTVSDRSTLQNGKQVVSINTIWNVPEEYSFMDVGFLFLLQEGEPVDESKLITKNAGMDGICKRSPSTLGQDGTYAFTLTLSLASKQKNLYTRGFITYCNNTTGEIITKYTAVNVSNAE